MEKQKPAKISPFIKASRYTFLISGIIYGLLKRRSLEAYEKRERVLRAKRYADKKEREKLEKAENERLAIIQAAKEFGADLKPDWKPPF